MRLLKTLIFIAPYFLLISFQTGSVPNLTGKWQGVKIIAPSQDSIMNAQIQIQNQQIDELTEVDSSMVNRFGTSDLPTIKKMAKEEVVKQPEQMKQQMKDAAAAFSFELMKDGKALMFTQTKSDKLVWYLGDNNKKLFLDPFEVRNDNPDDHKSVMIFDIISQTGDNMRLRVHQPLGQDVFVDVVRTNNKAKN